MILTGNIVCFQRFPFLFPTYQGASVAIRLVVFWLTIFELKTVCNIPCRRFDDYDIRDVASQGHIFVQAEARDSCSHFLPKQVVPMITCVNVTRRFITYLL